MNVNKKPYISLCCSYSDAEDIADFYISLGMLVKCKFNGYCKVSKKAQRPKYCRIDLARNSGEYGYQFLKDIVFPFKAVEIDSIEVYGISNRKGLYIRFSTDNKEWDSITVTPCAESKYIKHCTAGHE